MQDKQVVPLKRHFMFFLSSFTTGGAQRVATILCNHWVAQGYSVTLVSTYSKKTELELGLDSRVEIQFIHEKMRTMGRLAKGPFGKVLAIRKIIQTQQPDVIISFITNVNILVLLASIKLKIPVIISERTYPPNRNLGFVTSFLRKKIYRLADYTVMQTQLGLRWLEQSCKGAKGVVIGNPVSLPIVASGKMLNATNFLKDKKVILSVARLDRVKGVDILINAFSEIHEECEDYDLLIIGEGAERDNLITTIEHLGLQKRVHLAGFVENLDDWYRRSDLFVLSSRVEGFPNALLEAMAHGLPCVSFDCLTGPADLINSEVNGILVDPELGSRGLAKAIKTLQSQPETMLALGQSASEVKFDYSVEKVLAKWERLVSSVIGSG